MDRQPGRSGFLVVATGTLLGLIVGVFTIEVVSPWGFHFWPMLGVWRFVLGFGIAGGLIGLWKARRPPTVRADDPNRKAEFLRHADELGGRHRPVQVVNPQKFRTDDNRRIVDGE